MKLKILLFSFFITNLCFSQFSFPSKNLEPSWEMNYFDPYSSQDFSIRLGNDTTFCNHVWNSVDYFDLDNNFIRRIGFCRQENKKVYVRQFADCNDEEFLMYDFNAEEGDTLYCGVSNGYEPIETELIIGHVGTGWFNGVPKKVISASYQNSPFFPVGMIWVEGVGDFLRHPFYSLECFGGCGEESYDFICLNLNGRHLFNNIYTNLCEVTIDTIYVNKNLSGGNNNGLNWQNAFYDLQDALCMADSGDVVLVAQGTYFPTTETDRMASFLLPHGVSLLGGFIGNETFIDQRDFENYPTILSGDIGILNDRSDNSYHVLYTLGADSTTIIDGFTIENGMADHLTFSSPHNKGGGFLIDTDDMYPVANPTILNCVFRENEARRGGAVYCNGKTGNAALNKISNCSFFHNNTTSEGGAIYKKGGNVGHVQKIEDCEFIDNHAFSGGAIYMREILGVQDLNHCHFFSDSADFEGGAIFLELFNGDTEIKIRDCEFIENIADSGGAISSVYWGNGPNDSLVYKVESSIFDGNAAVLAGGGAISIGNLGNISYISMLNSVFKNNYCFNLGGAVYIGNGYSSKNEIIVEQCIFTESESGTNGAGALYYNGIGNGYGPLSNQTLINNSLFYRNRGALGFTNGLLGTVDAEINNCTFYDNGDFPIAKTWGAVFDSTFYNNITITNSILWEYTPVEKLFYNNNFNDFTIHDYSVKNSLINLPDCIYDGVNVCHEGMLYQLDPLFVDTLNNDFRLLGCSPAVNAGNNDFLGNNILYDLLQQQRIIDDTVDMGAYEQPQINIEVFYTVENATTINTMDGSIVIDSITGGDSSYFILWENGDTLNLLDSLLAGEYILNIIGNSGCQKEINIEVSATNSIDPFFSENKILIYPNPANELINVDFPSAFPKAELIIFDCFGKNVFSKNIGSSKKEIIEVSEIPAGIYFLEINVDGKVAVKKIVIN